MSLASAAAGTRPDEVTRQVAIIDLTVLLPLLFFGGLWLWQRRPWGYVLGGLLLVKIFATGFTLASTTALGAWWTGGIAAMVAGSLALLVLYLRDLQESKEIPALSRRGFKGGLG